MMPAVLAFYSLQVRARASALSTAQRGADASKENGPASIAVGPVYLLPGLVFSSGQ